MPTKPAKSDRAPKNRWSAAERATQVLAPHRPDGESPRKPAVPAPLYVPALDAASHGFAYLGVPANLVAALEADGIAEPFPIQAATIPDALAGLDVLGRGRTGSGKAWPSVCP
jgi:hypothetical protein